MPRAALVCLERRCVAVPPFDFGKQPAITERLVRLKRRFIVQPDDFTALTPIFYDILTTDGLFEPDLDSRRPESGVTVPFL
jgi:hypothetical protein